jgi:hypothetical protein
MRMLKDALNQALELESSWNNGHQRLGTTRLDNLHTSSVGASVIIRENADSDIPIIP